LKSTVFVGKVRSGSVLPLGVAVFGVFIGRSGAGELAPFGGVEGASRVVVSNTYIKGMKKKEQMKKYNLKYIYHILTVNLAVLIVAGCIWKKLLQ